MLTRRVVSSFSFIENFLKITFKLFFFPLKKAVFEFPKQNRPFKHIKTDFENKKLNEVANLKFFEM